MVSESAKLIGAAGAAIFAVIFLALMALKLYEKVFGSRAAGAVAGAEGKLYEHLSEQLAANTTALNAAYSERNELVSKYSALEVRLSHVEKDLKDTEQSKERLLVKLNEREDQLRAAAARVEELVAEVLRKNDVIHERDNLIHSLNRQITELRERTHQLEMRLQRDESEWCKTCIKNGMLPLSHDSGTAS